MNEENNHTTNVAVILEVNKINTQYTVATTYQHNVPEKFHGMQPKTSLKSQWTFQGTYNTIDEALKESQFSERYKPLESLSTTDILYLNESYDKVMPKGKITNILYKKDLIDILETA